MTPSMPTSFRLSRAQHAGLEALAIAKHPATKTALISKGVDLILSDHARQELFYEEMRGMVEESVAAMRAESDAVFARALALAQASDQTSRQLFSDFISTVATLEPKKADSAAVGQVPPPPRR